MIHLMLHHYDLPISSNYSSHLLSVLAKQSVTHISYLLAAAQQSKKLIENLFVTMKINCVGYSGEAKNGIIGYNCEGAAIFMTELPSIIILGLILLIFCILLFVSIRSIRNRK